MSWMQMIAIGVVQGITECLPISSSGHLVLAERLLGFESSGVAIEVFLHLGTLAAIVFFYRRRWADILSRLNRPGSRRALALLLIATLPVAAAGFLFHDLLKDNFHSVRLVCADLIACGFFLLISGIRGEGKKGISRSRALVVGCAQAVALLPGVSRSGMTVGAGLLAGMKREEAFEFSFMLAVPAILGAALAEFHDIGRVACDLGAGPLLAGTAAAFVSGYVAIGVFYRAVVGGKLVYFGYYCIAVGAAGMLWL